MSRFLITDVFKAVTTFREFAGDTSLKLDLALSLFHSHVCCSNKRLFHLGSSLGAYVHQPCRPSDRPPTHHPLSHRPEAKQTYERRGFVRGSICGSLPMTSQAPDSVGVYVVIALPLLASQVNGTDSHECSALAPTIVVTQCMWFPSMCMCMCVYCKWYTSVCSVYAWSIRCSSSVWCAMKIAPVQCVRLTHRRIFHTVYRGMSASV